MKRELSQAAQAAKIIRKELKTRGIKSCVTSKQYSGGESVCINIIDQLPATKDAIQSYVSQFQYGSFNAMIDLYEYANKREDIPQARHVTVTNRYSDDLMQKAWDHVRSHFAYLKDMPESYQKAQDLREDNGGYVSNRVWRILTGMDESDFWTKFKPHVKV